MMAECKVRLPGSVHIQAHRLSHSLGKLLGVHFLFKTMQGVFEVWENKWLVLAELKRWLLLLLGIIVLAVSCQASSRAADIDYLHQDVAASQTGILRTAGVLHRAGGLRPFILCVFSIKETLVSFGLHCWLIDSPGKQKTKKLLMNIRL